jgi:hypothetical protein
VQVPSAISLIGIDDTLEALNIGLTSYAFPTVPVTHALFEHIMRPDRTTRIAGTGIVEIQGQVITRKTTGRAPNRNKGPFDGSIFKKQ